jgi:hypothetical protein
MIGMNTVPSSVDYVADRGKFYIMLAACAIHGALLCITYGIFHLHWRDGAADTPIERLAKTIFVGFWVIVPPVWFAIEYFHFFAHTDFSKIKESDVKAKFDYLKHGQDLASKGWLALVTLLTALYFGRNFTK